MNKKIIIVEGMLASGKSTFAKLLANRLNVPCFVKDDFKIAICNSLELLTREEKSKFSVVTFDAMMYVAERIMESGSPLILEGNFVPSGVKKVDEAMEIKNRIERYDYDVLTFKFSGDTKILCKRYIERDKTEEREQVNKIGFEISLEDFDLFCQNLVPFDVDGKVVKIDTTDFSKVDFEKHIETAREFLEIKNIASD